MKKYLGKFVILAAASLLTRIASAQVYSQNIVGYANIPFNSGENLFENPLLSGSDTLTNLFNQGVPNGTTISLWSSSTASFSTSSTYMDGWSINLALAPGIGAELDAPTGFTNTFVGTVLNHDGSVYSGGTFVLPPVFSGPNGTYLWGDKTPGRDAGSDIFLNILGRLPNVGEQVTTLSGTSTYLGGGTWDNVPVLNVGQAAFLTIGADSGRALGLVPEPGSLGLLSLGALSLGWCARRLRVNRVR